MKPALLALLLALIAATPAAAASSLTVAGNALVDDQGQTVRLLGVDRSGTEYACADGWGFADSPDPTNPDSPALIAAMRSWNVNAVRVPLNEACWLGINGVKKGLGGPSYRHDIHTYVARLEQAGINPILDLHVVTPGKYRAPGEKGLRPLPDRAHSLTFWKQVAKAYGNDRQVVFDLYNEPNDTTWRCLRDGCRVTEDNYDPDAPPYRSVGTQDLVEAIRAAGATNVIMVPGIQWTEDLSRWLRFKPRDPLHRLAASFHVYEPPLGDCLSECWDATIAPVAAKVPVITGEFGDVDCDPDFSEQYMDWADAHGVSYLAWTWDAVAPGGWSCNGGPALIADYLGTPTGYGVGVRDHLLGQ